MKNNKKVKIITWSVVALLILGIVSLIIFLVNKNSNEYTFNEKKWISSNTSQMIDIYVQDDMPAFSYKGEGVFLDFLKALEADTGLKFNINYETSKNYDLVNSNTKKNNEIVFFTDHYVILSLKESNINYYNDLSGKNLGVTKDDIGNVSSYLSSITSATLTSYDNYDSLYKALNDNEISYVVVPLYLSLDEILVNNYNVELHLDGVKSYYSFRFNQENQNLYEIVRKFYNRWINKFEEKRNNHLVELYYDIEHYTGLSKDSIVNDDFVVGYMQNLPYEGTINGTFTGLTNAYLEGFSNMTGTTYKYVEYKSIDKLNAALINKKIDIMHNYYKISNNTYSSSAVTGSGKYVVLAYYTNEISIESFNNIIGNTVSTLSNFNITKIINATNKSNEYKNVSTLVKKSDRSDLIIVDKNVYEYYKNKEFKNYVIRYTGVYSDSSDFLLLSSHSDFNKLFNFYIKITSPIEMQYKSLHNTINMVKSNIILTFILKNIIYIIIGVILLGYIIYKTANKVKLSKKIKKEDKLMYLDVMTNLKNRNYLNDNLTYWEENKIYPQSIVIIDLNKIKELNDLEGHEAGDKQIKATASVLIKTQRDNSEIIRTDGNEFLIYLVGYEEKYIISYIHRINKEFKNNLPYKEHGAAVGYSMINDELKTIDDAINEALIMMRDNKAGKNE